jgi:TonB family protein
MVFYQSYLDDGKTIRITGRLMSGKRTGKWTFKDSKGIPGLDAVYLADSVISAVCYNELGQIETGKTDCQVEKPAGFKGGNDGWRRYLERSLVYPEDAVKNNIQGVVSVEFVIERDGSVSNAKVLGSPDELLAAEALRLIKKSPKWEPAIQYNRQVIYRHIQTITFAFQ